jgi:hypothetical protein
MQASVSLDEKFNSSHFYNSIGCPMPLSPSDPLTTKAMSAETLLYQGVVLYKFLQNDRKIYSL